MTKVYGKLGMHANTSVILSAVNYTVRPPSANDPGRPLLIAVDFSAAPASGIRYVEPVPAAEATAYFNPGAEAASMTRSANYTPSYIVGLIEKIEVG